MELFKLFGVFELKGADKAKDELEGIDNKASGMGGRFTALGGIVGAAATAITGAVALIGGAMAKTGIQFNASMEQSEIAWTTLLGSADAAKERIAMLQELGAKTPFEFAGLDKSAKLLDMAGFKGKDLEETLVKVGDAVSAVGGGQEELEGVSTALFQMSAKGKISAEEMSQMAERGIPVWQILADKMGKSTQEVMKMSENGKLLAEDTIPLLVDGMGTKFGGAMEKQSQSFNGMMSTLKDNWTMFTGEITEGLFNKLKTILPVVIDTLEQISTAFQEGGISGIFKELLPPDVYNFIVSAFTGIKDAALGFVTYVKPMLLNFISEVKTWWKQNGDELMANFKIVWDAILAIVQFLMPVLKALFETAITAIKNIVMGGLNFIKGLFQFFAGLVQGDMGKMWEGLKKMFSGAIQFVWGLVNLNFVRGVLGLFTSFKASAVSTIKGLWDDITKKFSSGKDTAVTTVTSLKDKAVGIFQNVLTKASEIFGKIKKAIKDPIKEATDFIKAQLDKIVSFFRDLKVPKFKIPLPHFKLKGKFSLKDMTVPTVGVDWYKKGGIFDANSPQVIGVGDHPTAKEAALPLTDKVLGTIGESIAKLMPQQQVAAAGGGDIVINLDGYEIARVTNPYIDRLQGERVSSKARFGGNKR